MRADGLDPEPESGSQGALFTTAVTDPAHLREVSRFFVGIWGRTEEGAPVSSEIMRAVVHAGGLVSGLYRGESLLGAAVLGRAQPGRCYSYLAATDPSVRDSGLGGVLKDHQRAWARREGLTAMSWTFDPLVARNARFNLVKLGAVAEGYECDFYGEMTDAINAGDHSDRLIVTWDLTDERSPRRDSERGADAAPVARMQLGPDGHTALEEGAGWRRIRVPSDIVSLRRQDPELARAWRRATRSWFEESMASGWRAVSMSRDGWYRLEPAQQEEDR